MLTITGFPKICNWGDFGCCRVQHLGGLVRPISYTKNQIAMLRNYFKIALRQLKKQGFYSAIKIGGFALGIATCLLIALYIRFELSFDTGYANGDRLYRVVECFVMDNGTIGKGPAMPAPFAQELEKEFPQ